MLRKIIVAYFTWLVCHSYSQVPTFQWVAVMGGTSNADGASVKVDATNNVYSSGNFLSTVDFDPSAGTFSLSSKGLEDVYISKLDASGNFIWAKSFGSKGSDKSLSLTLDGLGNIYATGFFSDTTDFDPGPGTFTLISSGNSDVFIAKFDVNGNFIWAKKLGGVGSELGYSIAFDGSSNIYTCGYFTNTCDFDPSVGSFTLAPVGNKDVFISKLDASGNFIWAKQLGGSLDEEAYSISVDPFGDILTTGYFSGTADFDPSASINNITSFGGKDIFISKLNSLGNFIWGKNMGSSNDDVSYSIGVDLSGNVHTTGGFAGSGDFDPGPGSFPLPYLGAASDIFISKLDVSGNFIWAKAINSFAGNEGHSIFVDASGNVYSTGFYCNTPDFDPGPGSFYMSQNSQYFNASDVYVLKLNSSGNFVWARGFGGAFSEGINALTVDASTNVYLIGSFPFTCDFDPGANVVSVNPNWASAIYINKLGPCTSTPSMPISTTPSTNLNFCANLSTTLTASGAGTIYWYPSSTGTTALGSGSVYITPPLSTGSYTYYALASTCTVSPRTAITVTVNNCVGINEIEIANAFISIFPNPNNGSFILQIENEIKNGELVLFNSIGQEVYNQKIIQGTNNINDLGFAQGLYNYVLFRDKQKVKTGKIIIE